MKKLNYYIGLDIGTNSVGWAVSDEDLNLLRTNRKEIDKNNIAIKKNVRRNLWGSRLFESANVAKERRIFRSQRRRLDRRKERINLLQQLLAPMVNEKDNLFFLRMKETFLQGEDKDFKLTFPYLFKNKEDYQKTYKSIYHLRKKIIESKEQIDPRLVYLAIHHIIKYRGNFLYEGNESFNVSDEKEIEDKLNFIFEKINEEELVCKNYKSEIITLLKDTSKRNKDKIDELKNITSKDKIAEQILKSILGQKFNISTIVNEDDVLKNENKTISFSDKYEDHEEEYLSAIGGGSTETIFLYLKEIYDWNILFNLIGDNKYLSDAMVNKYNKHKEDLRNLKNFIKVNCPDKFNEIFRDKSVSNNYLNYVATGNRADYSYKTLREDFYKYIKKILEPFAGNKDADVFLSAIENNEFLNKLRFRDNGVIPYQLHKTELEKIIDNQGEYYSCLKENKNKIISLLTFRVPYYVGPLNNKSNFAWVKRKYTDKITPWTFDNLVDKDASAEEFITRMTNKCTYLVDEDVMPKNSIIYSKYCVLNELNKIKINDKLIDKKVKNQFYEEVFKSKVNVKEKHLRDFLIKEGYVGIGNDKGIISGFGDEKGFLANMKSYIDFQKILFPENKTIPIPQDKYPMIEEIIKWITIFEDNKILERKINAVYSNELTPEQIKKISKLKYTGWGRLCEKLINRLTCEKENRNVTILDIMHNTNKNFMEIINGDFKEILEKEQKKYIKSDKIKYEDVAEIQGSPALKRGIWQALKIVDEIVDYMGCEPKKIYLEFARDEDNKNDKKRTNSRYKQLEEKYKNITKSEDFQKVLSELKKYEKDKTALNEEKLYLYFIQCGKSMYSDKTLNIDDLSKYHVDHIIPQSIIKDDSIENKALVLYEENLFKSDKDVLPPEIIGRMQSYWQKLYECGLIGDKKLNNLKRSKFSSDELGRFINRQIVETRQILKHVVKLLKQNYSNTQICKVNASISSEFRDMTKQYKIREINDCHHAQDAYLSIVMGNYIEKVLGLTEEVIYGDYNYLRERYKRLSKEREKILKEEKDTKKYKYGYVVGTMFKEKTDNNTGEILWDPTEDKLKIIKTLNYNDYFITKKVEEDNSSFYDINLLKKSKTEVRIPMGKINGKSLDTEKYGGYSGETKAYFTIVEYDIIEKSKKEEKITNKRDIIGIPIQKAYLIKNKKEDLYNIAKDIVLKSLNSKQKIVDNSLKILKKKILQYQLIKHDNSILYITSQDYVINGKYFILDKKYQKLIYELFNKKLIKNEENESLIIEFYNYYIEKLINNYNMYVRRRYTEKLKDFNFINLEFENKVLFIEKILKLIGLCSCQLDLKKDFGLTTGFGILNGYKLSKDTIFIDQSVTGLKEKVYKL